VHKAPRHRMSQVAGICTRSGCSFPAGQGWQWKTLLLSRCRQWLDHHPVLVQDLVTVLCDLHLVQQWDTVAAIGGKVNMVEVLVLVVPVEVISGISCPTQSEVIPDRKGAHMVGHWQKAGRAPCDQVQEERDLCHGVLLRQRRSKPFVPRKVPPWGDQVVAHQVVDLGQQVLQKGTVGGTTTMGIVKDTPLEGATASAATLVQLVLHVTGMLVVVLLGLAYQVELMQVLAVGQQVSVERWLAVEL